MKRFYKREEGFTLIELLLVVAILAVLAVAVFVALNPGQRLKDAKDARRTSDTDSILSAIHQSIVDSKGSLPTNMPAAGTEAQLGTAATGCAIATAGCAVTQAACVDLMSGTQNLSKYLKSMPVDPSGGTFTAAQTGYSVVVDTNGIVTVKACGAEGGTNISASR
ncbi:MAG: prepilin-type N-terminal cleavage/methylation domain-containing protein [Candidatus Woesebacteria bacterium]|nr:MAG: prepilin-type N-terminal cleavage/methylation domain-containing protein [Candidatus Woesebacteria bacterium]